MAAKTVTVVIAPNRRVQIDGKLRGPGEVASVPERDAKILVGTGYAERVKRSDSPSPPAAT